MAACGPAAGVFCSARARPRAPWPRLISIYWTICCASLPSCRRRRKPLPPRPWSTWCLCGTRRTGRRGTWVGPSERRLPSTSRSCSPSCWRRPARRSASASGPAASGEADLPRARARRGVGQAGQDRARRFARVRVGPAPVALALSGNHGAAGIEAAGEGSTGRTTRVSETRGGPTGSCSAPEELGAHHAPRTKRVPPGAFGEGGRRHGGLRNGRLCSEGRSRLSAHPPNVRGGATYLEQPAPRRPARVNRLRAGLPALRGRSPFSRAPGGAVRAPSQHHRGTMVGDDRLGRKNGTVPLISLLLTATREPGCQQPPGCDCVRGTRPG